MNSLVSVIITSYKRVESTERAVISVLKQDYETIELIVVDDNGEGSKEQLETEKNLLKIADSRLTYIKHKKNRGGNAARNTGVKASSGDFIGFLDNDDVYYKNKIRVQLSFLTSNPSYSAVACGRVYLSKQNNKRSSYSGVVDSQVLFLLGWQESGGTSSLLFRRQSLIETGVFDESLKRQQEVELLCRFLAKHKLFVMNDYLLEIDSSDRSNIPKTNRYVENKKLFLSLCKNSLTSKNYFMWSAIVGFHNYDICKVALRNKGYSDLVKYLFIAFFCAPSWPFIVNDFLKKLSRVNKNEKPNR